jgi:KDO2-lipid IV(A) lauroyltransferase
MSGGGTGYYWVRDRWHVRAGEWLLFALGMSVRALTGWLPVRRVAEAAAPVGALGARLVPAFRRRAEENLARVWPDKPEAERRRILAGAGAHFARLGVEYAHLGRWARQVELEIEGAEHLPSGRPAVLVTAHYGNWEAIRLAARRLGTECGIIYRPFNNRYLDRFTLGHIAQLGEPVLHKGRTGMRALRAHLAAGGTALILVDQRNSGAPFLPFLGHPAETVTVAASLAAATGAALVPAVGRRGPGGRRFTVRFEPPVEAADPEAAMTAVNARIGAWIEAAPEQWFWFHRRWRATGRSRNRGTGAR